MVYRYLRKNGKYKDFHVYKFWPGAYHGIYMLQVVLLWQSDFINISDHHPGRNPDYYSMPEQKIISKYQEFQVKQNFIYKPYSSWSHPNDMLKFLWCLYVLVSGMPTTKMSSFADSSTLYQLLHCRYNSVLQSFLLLLQSSNRADSIQERLFSSRHRPPRHWQSPWEWGSSPQVLWAGFLLGHLPRSALHHGHRDQGCLLHHQAQQSPGAPEEDVHRASEWDERRKGRKHRAGPVLLRAK